MSTHTRTIDPDIFDNSFDFTGTKILLCIGDDLAIFEQRDGKGNFPFQIDLIGGGRVGNESPFETTVREVFEETGLHIDKSDLKHAQSWPSISQPEKIAFFFVAYINAEQIYNLRQGDEGLGIILLDPNVYITLKNGVEGQQKKVIDYLQRQ